MATPIMNESLWFTDWRQPAEFLRNHAIVGAQIKDVDRRARQNKWFREAKILGLFATAIGAASLRIIENDPPDGEVRLGDDRGLPIEIAEAFQEGRQPDKESKTGNPKHAGTVSEWDKELGEIRETIERALKKKEAHTNYPEKTVLVVYLNMGNDPRSLPPTVVENVKAACNPTSSKFDAICILWRDRLFGPAHIVNGGQASIDWRLIED
jgi:hypothetical protein